MPFKNYFLLPAILFLATNFYCQVGIGTTTPAASAMLEVSSTSDEGLTYKGLMPPRVPNEEKRDEIPVTEADDGLMVYVQDIKCLQIYNGTTSSWEIIHCNSSSSVASDLFISEYVEGTSNNKAIEIANFTGSSKNLNDYSLVLYVNGSSSPQTPISFNSNFVLADGAVYVIKHTSASSSIVANQTSDVLTFNGDDVVALRYNGANIDVFGTIGNPKDNNYAKDHTYRKKPATGPSTTYSATDYDEFPVDTFDGLGSHTY